MSSGEGYANPPRTNIALSMAARKRELAAKQSESSGPMIQQNKKRVLDALNKRGGRKY